MVSAEAGAGAWLETSALAAIAASAAATALMTETDAKPEVMEDKGLLLKVNVLRIETACNGEWG